MIQHWFKTLFAATGTKTAVPNAADPSGFISYDTGYGPDYERVLGTDPLAKTIERDKLNQVLYDITGAIQQYQTFGFPEFITTANNGGTPFAYDLNAIVKWTDGNSYISTVAGNVNAPGAAGWAPFFGTTPSNRNRFINGAMNVSQIFSDAAATITAGAPLQYVIDQWYAYCTGANVTGQRIAGSLQSRYRYQYTGAASVTKIGHAQRMESINTYDLNGQSTIVGVDMSNSLLTTVTWTAWYANTTNTFGTLDAPTRTQISTGTITVSPVIGRYYIPIAIPSAATTGIEIEFSVGAQISGTWIIGKAQFEKVPAGATQGTEFEWLPIEEEEIRCQRYYEEIYYTALVYTPAGFNCTQSISIVPKRVIPSLVVVAGIRSNAIDYTVSVISTKLIQARFSNASADTSIAGDVYKLSSQL